MTALRVAAFELRRQLRGHVFWVVFAVSSVMVLGSVSMDELRVGLSDQGLRNGASAVVRTHLVWSLFFMFTAATFVSDAALRDHVSGFAPIVAATPARRTDLLLGRFAGAFAAVVLCFLSVPAALAMGSHAPWVEPSTVGPFRPWAYLFAFALALPNLFLMSAAFFVLASSTRSLAAAMLGAVGLLVLYGLGGEAGGGSPAALFEPFGFAAYARATEGWTSAMRDVRVPAVADALLVNRLIWTGVGGALLIMVLLVRPRAARARVAPVAVPDEPALAGHDFVAAPRFTRVTALAQFTARTRFEFRQIVRSPVLAVLLLLGIANAGAALWAADTSSVDATVRTLLNAFRLLPTVVALFFAGELVWNERERRVHAIVGTSPMADFAYLLPKLLALAVILAMLAAAGAAAALTAQAVRGQGADMGALLRLYVVPAIYDWSLVATLALFFQALAPNKLAGWGYMVLYLIASLALQRMGYDDPLYRYGRYPGWPLPEAISGAEGVKLYKIYWGALAIMLTVLAFGLVGRGESDLLRARLAQMPARLRGTARVVGVAASAAFVMLLFVLSAAWRRSP